MPSAAVVEASEALAVLVAVVVVEASAVAVLVAAEASEVASEVVPVEAGSKTRRNSYCITKTLIIMHNVRKMARYA